MKKLGLENVAMPSQGKKLPAGGYICRIVDVEDFPLKEYLKIKFDIAEGDYKNYYSIMNNQYGGFWRGVFIKSYKEKALPYFKLMIHMVKKSNNGYEWHDDEKSLIGKRIGLVLGEEEYLSNTGYLKTRLYMGAIVSVEDIINNNFKVPELKRLKPFEGSSFTQTQSSENPFVTSSYSDEDDENLPF